jgi:hypothetical protein
MITSVSRVLGKATEHTEGTEISGSVFSVRSVANQSETKRRNQKTFVRNDYPRRSRGVLSNHQKATLCMAAREAFEKMHGRAPLTQSEGDRFRHEHVVIATGKAGLRDCVQDDYLPVKAHFLDLIGESGAAMNAHLAHGVESRKLALHHLEKMCEQRGVNLAYAASICRSMFKCALDDASVKQLWKITFRLKTRRSKRAAKRQDSKPKYVEGPF